MTDSNVAQSATKVDGEPVKMQDGRVITFVGKRKLLKETIVNGNDVSVRLDFRNGETRTFAVPEAMLLRFAGHGAEQKLGDETAGVDDVDDMTLAVDELIDRLNKGEWGTRREGSGMSGTSVLLRALVEYTGKTVEQVKSFLSNKSMQDKRDLRNAPEIKPIVDRIEAEKVSKRPASEVKAVLAEIA